MEFRHLVSSKKRPARSADLDFQSVMDSIRRIVRALRHSSKEAERDLNLSTAQYFVLQKIASSDRPMSINELARATLTHQSSVSVVASKLVRRGLVERIANEADSRSVLLKINAKGRKLLGRVALPIQDRLMNGMARMSIIERRSLAKNLQELVRQAGLGDEAATMLLEDGLNDEDEGGKR